MPRLASILEKLARAQEKLLRASKTVPTCQWKIPPQEGCWSAAEVIAHVIGVERTVVAAASRILRKEPKRIPVHERFRLPFVFVEKRLLRLKTPIPVDQRLLQDQKAMLAQLVEARGVTLHLIEQTKDRDLSLYRWRHPFLGSLNAYEWFLLLASHQIRHAKQMREISERLPKVISDLQK